MIVLPQVPGGSPATRVYVKSSVIASVARELVEARTLLGLEGKEGQKERVQALERQMEMGKN